MAPPRRFHRLGAAAAVATIVSAAPCDIYGAANTPCIAAHSTVRALYTNFTGALYQVTRNSDATTSDITVLAGGAGIANAASQDTFCANTTCVISVIYDQSGMGNHLSRAPKGAFKGPNADGSDDLAGALGAPVLLNGAKAYGVFVSPGTGYRNNMVKGSATGDAAQGIYAVLDGTHFNAPCCFDYGNAETNSTDTGNGHMEALTLTSNKAYTLGAGAGPWVGADLENGIFTGNNITSANSTIGVNPNNPSQTSRFLTGIVKGEPGNTWALRGGDASSGNLSTYYSGARPAGGYNPMSKEGAIILGIGGDNSNGGQGTFYEGVMTTGYPTDATEDAVQADIVAAKYTVAPLSTGPALTPAANVSFRATSSCCATEYLSNFNATVQLSATQDASATWTVRVGLANDGCFSFESASAPGSFVRHANNTLAIAQDDGSMQLHEDATFCSENALNALGSITLRSWNFPAKYVRHYNSTGYVASEGGPEEFDAQLNFNDDVSFVLGAGF